MTDNDRHNHDFNQCLQAYDRGSEKEVLTRKTLYDTLTTRSQFKQKNTMKTEWIARLKALANENYSKGYGWQVLVECYDTNDWLDLVECCDTWADALNLMIRTAEIQTDRYNDANAEIL